MFDADQANSYSYSPGRGLDSSTAQKFFYFVISFLNLSRASFRRFIAFLELHS